MRDMTQSEIRDHFFNLPPVARLAFEMLNVGIMIADKDFNIIFMNCVKREKYPDLVPGMNVENELSDHEARWDLARRAMQTKTLQENPNCTIMEKSGVRHLDVKVSPVIDEKGVVLGVLEIVSDVEDLYQSHAQLERLNKEYENVIYALSHDLRAPLVSIDGFLRKLKKGHVNENDEVASHCVDRIHANVKMMNEFVNVLLDTSRIATGRLDFQVVDSASLVQEVVHQFSQRAVEQGAVLRAQGDFPPIRCDRIRAIQAFSNLVGNILLLLINLLLLFLKDGLHQSWVFLGNLL